MPTAPARRRVTQTGPHLDTRQTPATPFLSHTKRSVSRKSLPLPDEFSQRDWRGHDPAGGKRLESPLVGVGKAPRRTLVKKPRIGLGSPNASARRNRRESRRPRSARQSLFPSPWLAYPFFSKENFLRKEAARTEREAHPLGDSFLAKSASSFVRRMASPHFFSCKTFARNIFSSSLRITVSALPDPFLSFLHEARAAFHPSQRPFL